MREKKKKRKQRGQEEKKTEFKGNDVHICPSVLHHKCLLCIFRLTFTLSHRQKVWILHPWAPPPQRRCTDAASELSLFWFKAAVSHANLFNDSLSFRLKTSLITEYFADWSHLDSMSDVIQHAVVDGLPDVAHRPLRIGRGNDFMRAGRVLIGGQDADFSPRHLLFVDINGLKKREKHWISCLSDVKQKT